MTNYKQTPLLLYHMTVLLLFLLNTYSTGTFITNSVAKPTQSQTQNIDPVVAILYPTEGCTKRGTKIHQSAMSINRGCYAVKQKTYKAIIMKVNGNMYEADGCIIPSDPPPPIGKCWQFANDHFISCVSIVQSRVKEEGLGNRDG